MCTVVHSRRHTLNCMRSSLVSVKSNRESEDNTEGIFIYKLPVETKCEIASAKALCESYSPIPLVIEVLLSLFKRDDKGSKI